jgi:polyhydroxyalkanoate synthesis regulator phasin
MGGTLGYLVDDATDFMEHKEAETPEEHFKNNRTFITGLLSHLTQKEAQRHLSEDPELMALNKLLKTDLREMKPDTDLEVIAADLRRYSDAITRKTYEVQVQSMDKAIELSENILYDYDVAQTDPAIAGEYHELQYAHDQAIREPEIVMESHRLCHAIENFMYIVPPFKEDCREYVESLLEPIQYGAHVHQVQNNGEVLDKFTTVDLLIGQAIVPRDFVAVVDAINDLSEVVLSNASRKMSLEDAKKECEDFVNYIRNLYEESGKIISAELSETLDEIQAKLPTVTTKSEVGEMFKKVDKMEVLAQ